MVLLLSDFSDRSFAGNFSGESGVQGTRPWSEKCSETICNPRGRLGLAGWLRQGPVARVGSKTRHNPIIKTAGGDFGNQVFSCRLYGDEIPWKQKNTNIGMNHVCKIPCWSERRSLLPSRENGQSAHVWLRSLFVRSGPAGRQFSTHNGGVCT